MQAWYHCENTYPFVPQKVLDAAELGARQPAQQILRPEDRRAICSRNASTSTSVATSSASTSSRSSTIPGINSLYGA